MINISQLTQDYYKPWEVAQMLHISVQAVQRWCKDWKLQETRTTTNRRLVTKESVIKQLKLMGMLYEADTRKDVIYTSKEMLQDVSNYVITQNPVDLEIILNVWNSQLLKLMSNAQENKIKRIFIHSKHWFTKTELNLIQLICSHHKTEIIICS